MAIRWNMILATAATAFLPLGCSSGGGSSDNSSGSTSMIQAGKMSCAGVKCFGTGSVDSMVGALGVIHPKTVSGALQMYNDFNHEIIPEFNALIAKIEAGVAAGGATSCGDIDIGYNGVLNVNGISFDAKTSISSTNYVSSPFSTAAMTKKIQSRVSGGANFLDADIDCGAGTDASPLVARVITTDGSNLFNAWYERGSANHLRLLMISKHTAGQVYAAWFKTDDGDHYEFVLASGTVVYKGAGSRVDQKINFQDNLAGSPTCYNSVSGGAETCSYTMPTVTGLPGDLIQGGGAVAWASVTNSVVLASPSY